MPTATSKDLLSLFETDPGAVLDSSVIGTLLDEYFSGCEIVASVLGIDIYKYSSFPAPQQRLVPVVFADLYDQTVRDCLNTESAIFNDEDFDGRFIPTGDGGFNIFDTPLQSLIFASYFQANLSAYNGALWRPQLRRFVGPLTVRYAVTQDTVFHLDANWFGSAIISNARILSRDALNRCLFDRASIEWFEERLGTIESLQLAQRSALPLLGTVVNDDAISIVFQGRPTALQQGTNAFRMLSVQKIGAVAVKASLLDIYSVYAQVVLAWTHEDGHQPLMITLGNQNSAGIS